MNREEILRKAEANEGMTVEEIVEYQKLVKPQVHTYGKYGTLALKYLEEHNQAKMWALAGELPKYLHGIDMQADDLYNTLYNSMSKSEEYKKTGEFLTDLQKETAMQKIIEETILAQLVYETE